jgi:hypothetical protein
LAIKSHSRWIECIDDDLAASSAPRQIDVPHAQIKRLAYAPRTARHSQLAMFENPISFEVSELGRKFSIQP